MTQDYRVELDAYSGPLDLMLHLVRRHEIDLHDIPIAQLTQQYLEHLNLLEQINVELVGEFLVMAATLLEIKSAMLLPRPDAQSDAETDSTSAAQSDPRYELVQQLLAYKRFKDAAGELAHRKDAWSLRYPLVPLQTQYLTGSAHDADPDESDQAIEIDLEDTDVMELLKAYCRVMESVGQQPTTHEVLYDDTPISLHAADIADRLRREGPLTLQEVFVGRTSRSEKIGLFLAMLELVRQSKIAICQDRTDSEIRLELREEDVDAETQNTDAPPSDDQLAKIHAPAEATI